MVIRKAPNSSDENTASPFFIRINDVPQTSDRKIRINQAQNGVEKRPDEFVVSMIEALSVKTGKGTINKFSNANSYTIE